MNPLSYTLNSPLLLQFRDEMIYKLQKENLFMMGKDFIPSFPCQITPENSITKAK